MTRASHFLTRASRASEAIQSLTARCIMAEARRVQGSAS
ncbi:hypothetical protein D187_008130 [Cystobacter fuscus DSM 2262]|uniref:Uncharacterized protein n=1 Tax=Cystobacter fuscus (strain ATCC 25194 / DSM 2262 / NBRC 100088 / M29) TaxID=1242864 RepID=S9NUJ9_CYSF2|nr:hypothetical protein D187_008130 [Cystobacter fuscus DSM 2262]